MNVLMLLKPKNTVKYIYDTNTLRQGLEKMRAHSYTAIPVISEDGKYVGTVSEGDFLYYIVDLRNNAITEKEKHGQQRTGNGGDTGSIPAEVTNIQLRGADG